MLAGFVVTAAGLAVVLVVQLVVVEMDMEGKGPKQLQLADLTLFIIGVLLA